MSVSQHLFPALEYTKLMHFVRNLWREQHLCVPLPALACLNYKVCSFCRVCSRIPVREIDISVACWSYCDLLMQFCWCQINLITVPPHPLYLKCISSSTLHSGYLQSLPHSERPSETNGCFLFSASFSSSPPPCFAFENYCYCPLIYSNYFFFKVLWAQWHEKETL